MQKEEEHVRFRMQKGETTKAGGTPSIRHSPTWAGTHHVPGSWLGLGVGGWGN